MTLTHPKFLMIDDMPFLIQPLEKETFAEHDVIYAVLSLEPDGRAFIIDVGQSGETGAPPINRPQRMAQWHQHARGQLLVGVHRPATDFNMAADRQKIIQELRRTYHPPCGE